MTTKQKETQEKVIQACLLMIKKELSDAQSKIKLNRNLINEKSKEQRVLKAKIGELYNILFSLNSK